MRIIVLLASLALAADPAAPQPADTSPEQAEVEKKFDELVTIMTSSITCAPESDGRVSLGAATVTIKDYTYTVEMNGKTSETFNCLVYLGGGRRGSTPYFLGHNDHGDTVVDGVKTVRYHEWISHTPWNLPYRRDDGTLIYTARDGEEYAIYAGGIRGPVGDSEPTRQGRTDDGRMYGTVVREGKERAFVGDTVDPHGFDFLYFGRNGAHQFQGKPLYVGYLGRKEWNEKRSRTEYASVSIVWGDEVRTYEYATEPYMIGHHVYYFAHRNGRELLVIDMVEGPSYVEADKGVALNLDGSITYKISCDGKTMQKVTWGKEPSCNTNSGRK